MPFEFSKQYSQGAWLGSVGPALSTPELYMGGIHPRILIFKISDVLGWVSLGPWFLADRTDTQYDMLLA